MSDQANESSGARSEAIVAAFLRGWDGTDDRLISFWNRYRESHSLYLLSRLIKADLKEQLVQGDHRRVDHYFGLFPAIPLDHDRAISLVYEEFCLLEEQNAQPSPSEFCDHYEAWRDSLASQLGYHQKFSQLVGKAKSSIRYPNVGDRFATYDLRSILGRGATAQVYLATDSLMGGRNVVLKVSAMMGIESSILGPLDHQNIIPVFTVALSPETGLQGICMPYRPGKTLESVLATFAKNGVPRKALPIWESLELANLGQEPLERGWKGFPLKGTYTEAVAWMGIALSDALAYLHKKGIHHRDIKPANILLAHREGPLLFDFNLAHQPNAPEGAQAALNGGTLPYMAPEQLRAFLNETLWEEVGAAADIYALGLVLRELVTGIKPELPNSDLSPSRAIQDMHDRRHELVASTRDLQPDVPPSLDAIISKCLAFKPADRYASAQDVGEDLKRFLQRRRLIFAANSSWLELALNWVYRQRELAGGVFALLIFGILIVALSRRDFRAQAIRRGNSSEVRTGSGAKSANDASQMDSISKSQKFLQGIELLKSADQFRRGQARRIFEQIASEHPASAWPMLYLAESLSLIDPHRASGLVWQACRKVDAEAALQQRLQENPESSDLLVTLGFYYSLRNDQDNSKSYYEQAIARDPHHSGALTGLGRIAHQQKQHSAAIQYYQSAIQNLANRATPDPVSINQIRLVLVPALIDEVDRLLDQRPHKLDWTTVESLLKESQQQVAILTSQEDQDFKPGTLPYKLCVLALGRGALDSSRGYLQFSRDRSSSIIANFQQAAAEFEAASKIVDTNGPQTSEIQELAPLIQKQQNKLADRLQAVGIDDSALSR